MTSPASAPPPTPCSCNQGRVMYGPNVWSPCVICDGTGDRSNNRNFRDGWNAALAAQPPQPTREFVHPVSGDTVVVSTETGRILKTEAAQLAALAARAAQPPEPVIITRMLDGTLRPPPEPVPTVDEIVLSDDGSGIAAQAHLGAPPQPGDAARLAKYDEQKGCQFSPVECWGSFLRRLLDAAQSALADLGQAYIVIQEHRDEMQSTLAESQERAENLEADAANDAAEIISLRSALAESREATKVWAEEQKRWAEKLAERTSELTASRQDNQTLVHDVTEWRERYHAAGEECRAEVARLHDILQRGEDDLHVTDQKLYKAMEELARLRSPAVTDALQAAQQVRQMVAENFAANEGGTLSDDMIAYIEQAALNVISRRDTARSPTAAGEDREVADDIWEVADDICIWALDKEYIAYSSAVFYPLQDKIIVALAAAHARGVREGLEKAAQRIADNPRWVNAASAIRALAAQEPQDG